MANQGHHSDLEALGSVPTVPTATCRDLTMQRRTLSDANSAHSPRPRSTARWDFSVAGDEEQLQSKDGGLRGAERHERPWLQPRRPEAVSSSGVRYPLGRTSAESAWSPSERAADRQAAIAGTLSPRPSPAADSVFTTSPQAAGRGPKLCMEPRHFSESDAATTVHQRHLPSATVHDPSWHPGRLKCYSLHDRVNRNAVEHSFRDESRDETDWDVLHQDQEHVAEQAACSVNLDYLRQFLEQFAISHSTRFEVRLESCGHSRPSFSLRGVPLSSQPIIGTRYEKYAERLANMIHEINEWTTREWKADVVGYSRLLPVLSFHRNEPQCMSPLGAKERRTTGEPRIGSFEVVVAVCRDDCDDLTEFTLWSKLDSHAFPNMALLKDELMGLLQLTLDRMRGAERIQATQRRSWLRRKYLDESGSRHNIKSVVKVGAQQAGLISTDWAHASYDQQDQLLALDNKSRQLLQSAVQRSVLLRRYSGYLRAAGSMKGAVRRILLRRLYLNFVSAGATVKSAVRRSLASRRRTFAAEQARAAALNITKALRRSLLRRKYLDQITASQQAGDVAEEEATVDVLEAFAKINSAVQSSVLRGMYSDYMRAAGIAKGVVRRILLRRLYLDFVSAGATVKSAVRRSLTSRWETVAAEQAGAAAFNITKALRRSLLRRRYLDQITASQRAGASPGDIAEEENAENAARKGMPELRHRHISRDASARRDTDAAKPEEHAVLASLEEAAGFDIDCLNAAPVVEPGVQRSMSGRRCPDRGKLLNWIEDACFAEDIWTEKYVSIWTCGRRRVDCLERR